MVNRFEQVPIEEVRDFWNGRPCNIRHSPKAVGTKEYFDEVEARKYRVEPHIPAFAEFDRWAGKRVLEIGCGIGTDTISFARAGATVTAVELSERSIDLARERARVFGLSDTIDFVSGNAEELDRSLPRQEFDLIYSFGVLHHTPRPEAALAQARSYLAPHGFLKMMVYHRWSWKVAQIVLTEGRGRFWTADEIVARYSEAQSGSPVTYTYSRRTLEEMLRGQGFEPVETSVEHIFRYRVADYLQYKYVQPWHFRALPEGWFRWLEHRLGWHLCATARAA